MNNRTNGLLLLAIGLVLFVIEFLSVGLGDISSLVIVISPLVIAFAGLWLFLKNKNQQGMK